jgi:transposase-like protein
VKPRQFKKLIALAAGLSPRQRVDLAEVLNRGLRQEQAAQAIEASGAPRACPHCRCPRLHRDGHADGLQRYRCVGCARSFNVLTGTPLARLRHRPKWLAYLD